MTKPNDDFAQWDCPGAALCNRDRTVKQAETARMEIFPCVTCKAPKRTIRDDGTIVYLSYADYVG